jgi:hypothetical protein
MGKAGGGGGGIERDREREREARQTRDSTFCADCGALTADMAGWEFESSEALGRMEWVARRGWLYTRRE